MLQAYKYNELSRMDFQSVKIVLVHVWRSRWLY